MSTLIQHQPRASATAAKTRRASREAESEVETNQSVPPQEDSISGPQQIGGRGDTVEEEETGAEEEEKEDEVPFTEYNREDQHAPNINSFAGLEDEAASKNVAKGRGSGNGRGGRGGVPPLISLQSQPAEFLRFQKWYHAGDDMYSLFGKQSVAMFLAMDDRAIKERCRAHPEGAGSARALRRLVHAVVTSMDERSEKTGVENLNVSLLEEWEQPNEATEVQHNDPSASSYRPPNNDNESINRNRQEQLEAEIIQLRERALQSSNDRKRRQIGSHKPQGGAGGVSSANQRSYSQGGDGGTGRGGPGRGQPHRDDSPFQMRRSDEGRRNKKRDIEQISGEGDDNGRPEDDDEYPSDSEVPEDDQSLGGSGRHFGSQVSDLDAASERCNDPYTIGLTAEEGKVVIMMYGVLGGVGIRIYRMPAAEHYHSVIEKGWYKFQITQLQMVLYTRNNSNMVARSGVVRVIIQSYSKHLMNGVLGCDWALDTERYMAKHFDNYLSPEEEREVGYECSNCIRYIIDIEALRNPLILEWSLSILWSRLGLGCSVVNYEASKGSARTTAQTPCTSRNQGLGDAITNVQYFLTCCVGPEYRTCCNVMVVFLTTSEKAVHITGDHAAYNFDICMVSVSKALHVGTSMVIGDIEVSLVGARNVASAIDLRLRHQIAVMSNRMLMRIRESEFRDNESMVRTALSNPTMAARARRAVPAEHPAAGDITTPGPGPGKGPKKDKDGKGGGPASNGKTSSTGHCALFLAGALGVMNQAGVKYACIHDKDCRFIHKNGKQLTKKEAEATVIRCSDAELKAALLKKTTGYKGFLP
jgi:hypothetical protein